MAKKSILKDSLEELDNIKTKSIEIAKNQLISENADKLSQISAKIFEKLLDGDEEIMSSDPIDISHDNIENTDDFEVGGDEIDLNSDSTENHVADQDTDFLEIDIDDEIMDNQNEGLYENKQNKKEKNMKSKDLRKANFKTLLEAYQNMEDDDNFVVDSLDESWLDEDDADDKMNSMLDEMNMEDAGPDMDDETEDSDFFRQFNDHLNDKSWRRDRPSYRETDPNAGSIRGNQGQTSDYNAEDDFGDILEDMSLEALQELHNNLSSTMAEDDGGDGDGQDGQGSIPPHKGEFAFKVDMKDDYLKENDMEDNLDEETIITEDEINEIFNALNEEEDSDDEDEDEDSEDEDEDSEDKDESKKHEKEEIEENLAITSQTKKQVGSSTAAGVEGRPDRRTNISEEDFKTLQTENENLKKQIKTLEEGSKSLQEGFDSKIKGLEDKIYDVTMTAIKAGYANKLLLEHAMSNAEKTTIIREFANSQTKDQIVNTYKTLLKEFSGEKINNDVSIEDTMSKANKIHRSDKVILKESTMVDDRFKQLFNYNYGKKPIKK